MTSAVAYVNESRLEENSGQQNSTIEALQNQPTLEEPEERTDLTATEQTTTPETSENASQEVKQPQEKVKEEAKTGEQQDGKPEQEGQGTEAQSTEEKNQEQKANAKNPKAQQRKRRNNNKKRKGANASARPGNKRNRKPKNRRPNGRPVSRKSSRNRINNSMQNLTPQTQNQTYKGSETLSTRGARGAVSATKKTFEIGNSLFNFLTNNHGGMVGNFRKFGNEYYDPITGRRIADGARGNGLFPNLVMYSNPDLSVNRDQLQEAIKTALVGEPQYDYGERTPHLRTREDYELGA